MISRALSQGGFAITDDIKKRDLNVDNRLHIKDLPDEERPREKLFMYGVSMLSNPELIALILGNGTNELSALAVAEKLIALDLFRHCQAGNGRKIIGKKKFYDKYMELFHVCKKTISKYITHLRKIFRFTLNTKNYHISLLDFVKPALNAAEMYRQRIARTLIRRSRAISTSESFNDMVQLLKQYHNNIKNVVDVLGVAMKAAVKKEKTLQPALVHSLMLQSIGRIQPYKKSGSTKKIKEDEYIKSNPELFKWLEQMGY